MEGKKWNGKGYNHKGNEVYVLINDNGTIKEYDKYNNNLIFEGDYLNGQRNGKKKNIIILI